MGFLVKVPLLVGCLVLLINTKNALLCASVWAIAIFLMSVLFSVSFSFGLLLWGGVAFLLAFAYFALLNYLEGKGWWWVVMPIGVLVLLGV